ncbi:hypothetical protein V5799_017346 [Amblyomma americanum]|uniref:Peptidase M13 N-terminal domain-containing protein n=1 Tax=Amblyomma americanum TaxID=6943 RepID=A0AAQ4F2H2_AMBAM
MSPMNAAGKQNETQSFLAYGPEQREMLFSYFAVSLTVVAFCALLTALLFLTVPADPHDIVCTTASCAALDSLLEASVDWNRPPCTNFYAHVCSGWAQSHNFSVYRSHLHEFIGDVHWILARVLVPSHAQTPPQVVAAFYQSCTAVLVDGADELAPFRRQLQIAGVTWPRVFAKSNLMLTAASVYATFQVTALLRIRSSVRNLSSVLEVAPDETFLRGWRSTRDQLLRSGAYARFFHETKAIYAGNESSPGHLLDYQSFVRVEEVVLATLLQRRPIAGESEVRNIEGLAELTRNVSEMTWRKVAEKLSLSQSARALIINTDYLRQVDELLARVGERLLHYYLGWCVVQQMRRYVNQDLANSWYDYVGASVRPDQPADWKAHTDCMQLTEMLVGKLTFGRFVLWKVDGEDHDYVRTMAEVIARGLVQQVSEKAQWSHQRGRVPVELRDFRLELHVDNMRVVEEALGQRGLANRTSLISNWMDVAAAMSIINDTFRDRISTTYVKDLVARERYSLFDNTSRTLSLAPMFAMLPLYRRQLSDTAKFGALGTLLAKACFEVFLTKLANHSTALDEAFRRLRCFAESAQYRSDHLEIYHSAASFVIALDALRSLGSTDYKRLRMFDSLQSFFVLMCYLLCTPNTSDESIVSEAICNEAVKNSESFAVAFQCAPGTAMNPEKRCRFF